MLVSAITTSLKVVKLYEKLIMLFFSDLRAIVVQTNEKEHDNNGKVRRHINLLDETGQVCVTLWGSDASDFGDEEGFPILIRNAAVQVYDGTKMLNTYPYTSIWVSNQSDFFFCDEYVHFKAT